MKKSAVLIVVALLPCIFNAIVAQAPDINYFDQKAPGMYPQKFGPGFISKDGRYELMCAFSPDGKEFCFTVTNYSWSDFKIWDTKFDGTKWSEPQVLSFNMDALSPVFSPSNNALFFSSGNWGSSSSDIWVSKKEGTDWGQPQKLSTTINAGDKKWGFSIAKDSTLLFTSTKSGGKGNYDVYMAEPSGNTYKSALNMSVLNTSTAEYSAFISPDKGYIIYSSGTGYGWDDLYISFHKKDSSWSTPSNLGPRINTANAEYAPFVTPDGKYLIYSVWDANSAWSDIYWVSSNILFGPYLENHIKDQNLTVNTVFSFKIPANTFTDFEGDDSVTVTEVGKSGLPAWLTYDRTTRTLSGTPSTSETVELVVTANDPDKITAADTFNLIINNPTSIPPYVKNGIPDQTAKKDSLFNYQVPDSTFFDDDGNNTLTYSATLSDGKPLPSGINFNVETKTFSGTPDTVGTFKINVTATDMAKESASTQFTLTIKDNLTSINQMKGQKFSIYPNPTTGPISISFGGNQLQQAIAEVFNTEGKLLLAKTFRNTVNATIDLSYCPKGIYVLNLIIDGEIFNEKICLK